VNTTELVAQTRISGQLSSQDPTYTSDRILDELTHALRDRYTNPVAKLRQGFWKKSLVVPLVSGRNFYPLPPRAVIQGLELLEITFDGSHYRQLSIMTDTQAVEYDATLTGEPRAYVLESDGVRLIPSPNSSSWSLRMTYLLRPNELVPFTTGNQVVAIGSNFLDVTSPNPTSTWPLNTKLDAQHSSGSHEISLIDGKVASIAASGPNWKITFTTPIDLTRVQVDDYVRLSNTAVFPVLPEEFHRTLCDYTAGMILISKGDEEKGKILAEKAASGLERAIDLAQPRIRNSPFTWRNTHSYLRRNAGWR
jgi:hypothetical protein